MKLCIYGAGNTGHAISAYLASKSADFVLYTRNPKKAAVINEYGLESSGSVNGHFAVKASANLAEIIPNTDIILIMTDATAHRDAASKLKPLLRDNQKLLIFNSNWGAYEFTQTLGEDVHAKCLTIAETAAQLFVGSSAEPGKVSMSVKSSISTSATDPSKTDAFLQELQTIFPQLTRANSVLETSLSSTNPIIHVPIALMNLARIENQQAFRFYAEGCSRKAVEYILGIDAERLALGKALACRVTDVLTIINSFWEIKHDNLFDALTLNKTYQNTVGPKSLDHRYFTEDIPYGIAPIAGIGRLFGVPTPYTDALLDNAKLIFGGALELDALQFTKADIKSLIH